MGPDDRRGVRRLGRHVRRRVALPGGDLTWALARRRRLRRHADRRRRAQLVRHRGAEAGAPRRGGQERQLPGDRDVGARGGVGCRRAQDPRRARERRVRPERVEDVDLLRARGQPRADRLPDAGGLDEARGPLDDLRPARRRGHDDDADRDARRRRHERDLPRQRARPGREPAGRGRQRLAAADGRPEQGARDPGRAGARPRAARVRRRARVREGAQAVRPPDRQLPGAAAPLRAARDRADAGAAAGAPRRAADRRGPGPDASQGGVDGEARVHRAGEEVRARGDAVDGRVRLRDRVPDGAATCAPRS